MCLGVYLCVFVCVCVCRSVWCVCICVCGCVCICVCVWCVGVYSVALVIRHAKRIFSKHHYTVMNNLSCLCYIFQHYVVYVTIFEGGFGGMY